MTNSLLANRVPFVLLLSLLSVVWAESVGTGDLLLAPIRGADDAMEAFIRTAKGNEVKIDLRHVFLGDVSKSGKNVVGFHHISGVNPDRAKILSKGVLDKNRLYEAKVQIFNKLKNKWQTKTSTFFPDSWTRSKTLSEISRVPGVRPSGSRGQTLFFVFLVPGVRPCFLFLRFEGRTARGKRGQVRLPLLPAYFFFGRPGFRRARLLGSELFFGFQDVRLASFNHIITKTWESEIPKKSRVQFPGAIDNVVARGDGRPLLFHDQGLYERLIKGND